VTREKFKHTIQERVRSSEIDWQGIVHNAKYLVYFEDGRIAYLEQLGIPLDVHSVNNEFKVFVVRNEIDYRGPATVGQLLLVRTRISYIRRSSFVFEGILEDASTGNVLAENVSIHVYVSPLTGQPAPVPEFFRQKVAKFEGPDAVIQQFSPIA
jgi:acyl-CoA thioester hydrolase